MNQATTDFIREHREDDVRRLALKGAGGGDVDLPLALQQIAGWQMARQKLPTWATVEGIIYPPHLNMEQCSSEQTAKFKQCTIHNVPLKNGTQECTMDGTFIDLTGGLGVDFYFVSQGFKHRIYVEQQAALCDIARHNFALLGLECAVVCDNAADYLRRIDHASVIYLDPARRDEQGKRTYSIADCTPNVLELLPLLYKKTDRIVLKLSPMLDWHKAVEDLKANAQYNIMDNDFSIYIISVENECKELLIEMRNKKGEVSNGVSAEGLRVVCVNLLHDGEKQEFEFKQCAMDNGPLGSAACYRRDTRTTTDRSACRLLSKGLKNDNGWLFLYEPNASIMKAGCFDEIADFYRIQELSANSHLFVADHEVKEFPGRRFRIEAVSSMNKRELKDILKDTDRANIAVRNFPMSVEELRRRLRLKDGGEVFIFATTMADGSHRLLICRKIV